MPEEIHRAEADAHVTMALFQKILEALGKESKISTIEDAIRFQGDFESSLRLGWGISKAQIQELPADTGCFQFMNSRKQMVYFSATNNIKSEAHNLKRHIDLPKQLARQLLSAESIEYKKHDNLIAALKYEIDLYDSFQFKYTPHQRHGKWVHTISLVKEKNSVRVCIGYAPKKASYVFGPLFDSKNVQTKLQQIAENTGIEIKGRKKLIFPKEMLADLVTWIQDKTTEELKKLRKQKFSWRYLVQPEFRKNLSLKIHKFEQLENIEAIPGLKNLRDENGTFFIQKGKKRWILPLQSGNMGQIQVWKDSSQTEDFSQDSTPSSDDLLYPALTSWLVWSKRSEKDNIRYTRTSSSNS